MNAGAAQGKSPGRTKVFLAARLLCGLFCLYQTLFTVVVGIGGPGPAVVQGLVTASLLSGLGARYALLILAAVAAIANLAPYLDWPVYPWFTVSHPLGNAVLFALCGLGWLSRPLRVPEPPQAHR